MPSDNTLGQPPEAKLDNFGNGNAEHGREQATALLTAHSGTQAEIDSRPSLTCGDLPMRWPVGDAGHIAAAIYRASYLPQQEVAIVATLALLSGIAGRAYRTPTGATLSQYYLLVAPTGSGKDAIHKLIPQVLRNVGIPQADRFAVSERFVSAPALHRRLLEKPGFLALHPEFGKRLVTISSPRAQGGHDQQFGDKLTEAYEKEYMEGIYRSNPADCVPGVEWPALSFLGETTPHTFYRALTIEMMEDGFYSRFLTVLVTSERPVSNRRASLDLYGSAWEALHPLVSKSIEINDTPPFKPIQVEYLNSRASMHLDDFEEECRQRINHANKGDDAFGAAVWNRAHLKALKISSLLAVADNCVEPKISLHHASWAIDLVRRDARAFMEKVESGDVGDGDDVRQKKVMEICLKILQGKIKDKNPKLYSDGIVTRRVLTTNTSRLAPFKNHPLKATKALDETIRSLLDSGALMLVDKHKAVEAYGEHGKCYRVLDLDDHS